LGAVDCPAIEERERERERERVREEESNKDDDQLWRSTEAGKQVGGQ